MAINSSKKKNKREDEEQKTSSSFLSANEFLSLARSGASYTDMQSPVPYNVDELYEPASKQRKPTTYELATGAKEDRQINTPEPAQMAPTYSASKRQSNTQAMPNRDQSEKGQAYYQKREQALSRYTPQQMDIAKKRAAFIDAASTYNANNPDDWAVFNMRKADEYKAQLIASGVPESEIEKLNQYVTEQYYEKATQNLNEAVNKAVLNDDGTAKAGGVLGAQALNVTQDLMGAGISGFVGTIGEYLSKKMGLQADPDAPVNTNGKYNLLSNAVRESNQAAHTGIENSVESDFWKKALTTAYDFVNMAGRSAVDRFAFSGLGEGATKLFADSAFATSAMEESFVEGQQRGLDEDKAFAYSLIVGSAEALTEEFGLDMLFKMPYSKEIKQSMAKAIRKQMLFEGSEEFFAGLIDTIADIAINQDQSEVAAQVEEYKQKGDSEGLAVAKTIGKWVLDTGKEMLMAGGSAGISAGIQAAKTTNMYRNAGEQAYQSAEDFKKSANAISENAEDYVTEEDLAYGKKTKEYLTQLSSQENVSRKEKGKAAQMQELNRRDRRAKLAEKLLADGSYIEVADTIETAREAYSSSEEVEQAEQAKQYALDLSEKQAKGKKITQDERYQLFEMMDQAARNADRTQAHKEEVQTNRDNIETAMQEAESHDASAMFQAYHSEPIMAENQAELQRSYDLSKDHMVRNGQATEEEFTALEKAYSDGEKGKKVKGELTASEEIARNLGQQSATAKKGAKKKAELSSVSNKVRGTVDGEGVEVSAFVYNGKTVKAKLTNGQTVDPSQVKFENKSQQSLFTYAQSAETASKANALLQNYPSGSGLPIASYYMAFNKFYGAGAIGGSFASAYNENAFADSMIGKERARHIYDEGVKEQIRDAEPADKPAVKRKGTGTVIDKRTNTSNELARVLAEYLATTTGQNVEIGDDGVVNGSYTPSTSTFEINDNENLLNTFFHEGFGEFSYAWNRGEMESFIQDIINFRLKVDPEFAETNIDYKNKYESVFKESKGKAGEKYKSLASAANEMVFDSIKYLFDSEENVQLLVDYLNEKPAAEAVSSMQRFKDFFNSILQKIKALLNGDRNVAMSKMEAEEKRKYCERIIKIFDGAIQNAQNAQAEGGQVKTKFSMDVPVEQTKNLIASHAIRQSEFLKSLKAGGIVAPSIAVHKSHYSPNFQFGDMSLLFKKDTIDPSLNADNRLYGADANTPVYGDASIESEVDYDKTYAFADRMDELKTNNIPGTLKSDAYLLSTASYLASEIENKGAEQVAKKALYGNGRLGTKALYLADKGIITSDVVKTSTEKIPADRLDIALKLAEALDITEPVRSHEYLSDHRQEAIDALEKITGGVEGKSINMALLSALHDINNYFEHGGASWEKQEMSYVERDKQIESQASDEDVYAWLRDNLTPLEKNRGIYNGKERWFSDGRSRSFNALHWEVSLENIVRAMKLGRQNGGSIGYAAAERLDSIEEAKAQENRLNEINDEEMRRAFDDFMKRTSEIASLASENAYFDGMEEALTEAVANSKTKSGLITNLKKIRGINNFQQVADDLWDLVQDIRNMPTKYFEAKPMRVLGIDEIAGVVIDNEPTAIQKEIIGYLDQYGIPYRTFAVDNDTERLNQINELAEQTDTKFSVDVKPVRQRILDRFTEVNEYIRLAPGKTEVLSFTDATGTEYIIDEDNNFVDAQGDTVHYVGDAVFERADIANYKAIRAIVEDAIRDAKGPVTIKSDGSVILIDKDSASEFTGSKDTFNKKGSKRATKINAGLDIKSIIENGTPSNPPWEPNTEPKHAIDAKRGWRYYDAKFAITHDNDAAIYRGVIVVKMGADGKDRFHDYTGIKIESATPLIANRSLGAETANPGSNISANDQNDKAFSITISDEDYMDAVNAGDMETAQQMVTAAAKAAGYNVEAYHGTRKGGFTVFRTDKLDNNLGSHFGSQEIAEEFAHGEYGDSGNSPQVFHVFLKAHNPYVTYDWFGQDDYYPAFEAVNLAREINTSEAWSLIDEIKALDEGLADAVNAYIEDNDTDEGYIAGPRSEADKKAEVLFRNLRKLLEMGGYDSIEYENGLEVVGDDDWIIQKSNQIKSAEPVTYDDEGNIIPLSERFNEASDDIRWSVQVDNHGEPLSEGQVKYFANSKARDEQGRLIEVYHGSKAPGFTQFKGKGYYFFARHAAFAASYKPDPWAELYSGYVNIENPFEIDIEGGRYNKIPLASMSQAMIKFLKEHDLQTYEESGKLYTETDSIADAISEARDDGDETYDGIILHNISDAGPRSNIPAGMTTDDYIIFDSSQFKNSDNRNPTSDKDIRWSVTVDKTIDRARNSIEVEKLLDRMVKEVYIDDAAKIFEDGYMALANKFETPDQAMEFINSICKKIAQDIIKEYHSDYSVDSLAHGIAAVFSWLDNTGEASYSDAIKIMTEIAKPVVENNNEVADDVKEAWNEFLRIMKEKPFRLTDSQKAEAKHFHGTYGAYRTAASKYVNVFDNANATLTDMWPIFVENLKAVGKELSEDIQEENMPQALLEALESVEPETQNIFKKGNTVEEESFKLALNIIQRYFQSQISNKNVKSTIDKLSRASKRFQEETREEFEKELQKARREIEVLQRSNANLRTESTEWKKAAELARNERNAKAEELKKSTLDIKVSEKLKPLKEKLESAKEENKAWEIAYKAKTSALEKQLRKEANETRKKLKSDASKLVTMLDQPTDKKHVPDAFRLPLADFLKSLDFISPNADPSSNASMLWQDKMRRLNDLIYRITTDKVEEISDPAMHTLGQIIDEDLVDMMKEFMDKSGGRANIYEMTDPELKNLDKIIKSITSAINHANEVIINGRKYVRAELAVNAISEMNAMKPYRDFGKGNVNKLRKIAYDFSNVKMLDSISFFDTLGDTSNLILENLISGYKKKIRRIQEAETWFADMKKQLSISDKEMVDWVGENQKEHEFIIDGRTLKITTGEIMELYAYSHDDDARRHMADGGIKTQSMTGSNVKPIRISPSDFLAITNTLTEKQKKFVDELQKYLSTTVSGWGNETSLEAVGYSKFVKPNYWPIKVDSNTIGASDKNSPENASFTKIKNWGSTKNRNPNARNALLLSDAVSHFTDHVAKMASYNGMMLPIQDAMAWFNYKEMNFEGITGDTLQEAMERRLGKDAQRWFKKFIQDLNGDMGATDTSILSGFAGRYKAAAVAGNIRVALQQPTAYLRALDNIDAKYLLEGLEAPWNWEKGSKKAIESSEWAYWKSHGFYDSFLGESVKTMITGTSTTKEKFMDVMSIAAQKGDDWTWGMLYKAVEAEVKDTTDLKPGTKEYERRVNERFSEVIDTTQVVDTIFHRSDLMRSKNEINKTLTAFMMEPSKSYNMLYRAFRSGDAKRITRAVSAYILSALGAAFMAALADAGRQDDDESKWVDRLWKAAKDNALDNLNPLGQIPVLKEILNAYRGYDPTNYGLDALYESVTAAKDTYKYLMDHIAAKGRSGYTLYGVIKKDAKSIGALTGIPIYNLMREVETTYNNVSNFWGANNIATKNEWGSSDYYELWRAIDIGRNIEDRAAGLIEDGKDPKNLAKSLKGKFAEDLKKLTSAGRYSEATKLKLNIIKALMAAGYSQKDANNMINGWLTEK